MARQLHIHVYVKPRARTTDDDFKESEHPRAPNGEFTSGGGGSAGAATKQVIAKASGKSETKPNTPAKTAPAKKAPTPPAWTKHGGGSFSPAEMARLHELKVPPAWTEIKFNPEPNAALILTGKDSKGRTQYRYSAAHSEKAAAEKFARLKDFNQVASKIAQKAGNDMFDESLPQKTRDSAAVIKLISETGFRVGSDTDTGAEVKAHGASTLTAEHVKVNGTKLSFDFIGKKGVKITKTLDHPELARYISGKLKSKKTGPLFDTNDGQVRDYLAAAGGKGFKVKDFRTWNGTNMALKTLQGMPEPTNAKEYAKLRLHVGKVVSQHLGNTPTVALESYIDPAVFMKWSHLK